MRAAVRAAREAFPDWAGATPRVRRQHLHNFRKALEASRGELAELISGETGRPFWETLNEVDSMISRIATAIETAARRCCSRRNGPPRSVRMIRFKPIGALAVLSSFRMPGLVPNGHIAPALLIGNTLVLKPSPRTPAVGERLAALWNEAGLPPGVLNLVQGSDEIGASLVRDEGLDGVIFTGSFVAGCDVNRALADRPHLMLALEMGGDNPIVVHSARSPQAAAALVLYSAFLSSGQRSSSARRLIVIRDQEGDRFVAKLEQRIRWLRVGFAADRPEPFLGPLIDPSAAQRLLQAQEELRSRGARVLVPLREDPRSASLLHPGLIDVSDLAGSRDAELSGPLLQVIRVPDFDAAIAEANRNEYGLTAALLSDSRDLYDRFWRSVRAGVINWNRPTTGLNERLPFGGLGKSGNHRPGGSFTVDSCSDPVASLESPELALPQTLPPGLLGFG